LAQRHLVTTAIADPWHRLSRRPNAILTTFAQLADNDPDDLDGILATLALVDPMMRDAQEAYRNLPPADEYRGPYRAAVVTPFVVLGASRFSQGKYGLLYGGNAFDTAKAEVGHHQTIKLGRSSLPYGTMVQLTSWTFRVRTPLVDIRDNASSLHDPDDYTEAQRFGHSMREDGQTGIIYRSVRLKTAPGVNVGVLRPLHVHDVVHGSDWRILWNGTAISEWLESR
jgi:RES domain